MHLQREDASRNRSFHVRRTFQHERRVDFGEREQKLKDSLRVLIDRFVDQDGGSEWTGYGEFHFCMRGTLLCATPCLKRSGDCCIVDHQSSSLIRYPSSRQVLDSLTAHRSRSFAETVSKQFLD